MTPVRTPMGAVNMRVSDLTDFIEGTYLKYLSSLKYLDNYQYNCSTL